MGAEPSIELILQGDVKVNWCEETLVAGRGFLRGCADRSWLPGRSTFPTVAHPAFSDQPPESDDHLRKRHREIDHPPPCSVHLASFFWALCQKLVLSATHRCPACSGAGSPSLLSHRSTLAP